MTLSNRVAILMLLKTISGDSAPREQYDAGNYSGCACKQGWRWYLLGDGSKACKYKHKPECYPNGARRHHCPQFRPPFHSTEAGTRDRLVA